MIKERTFLDISIVEVRSKNKVSDDFVQELDTSVVQILLFIADVSLLVDRMAREEFAMITKAIE